MDLLSIGKICELANEPPGRVHRHLDRLGIDPQLILDDVEYFDRTAAGKVTLAIVDGGTDLPKIEA